MLNLSGLIFSRTRVPRRPMATLVFFAFSARYSSCSSGAQPATSFGCWQLRAVGAHQDVSSCSLFG